jgi:hypothetical protein
MLPLVLVTTIDAQPIRATRTGAQNRAWLALRTGVAEFVQVVQQRADDVRDAAHSRLDLARGNLPRRIYLRARPISPSSRDNSENGEREVTSHSTCGIAVMETIVGRICATSVSIRRCDWKFQQVCSESCGEVNERALTRSRR